MSNNNWQSNADPARQSWFSGIKGPTSNNTNNDGSAATKVGFLPQFLSSASQGNNEGEDSNQSVPSRFLSELRQRIKSWSEFFRFSKFGFPPNFVAVIPRIKHNLQYFSINYMCLVFFLFIYCILTSLLMLLAFIVLGGLCYTIYQRTTKGPLVFSGHEVPPSLLYTLALLVCFPLFAFADVGQVMYWVIALGVLLVILHSSFYSSEEVPGSEFEVVTVA